MTPDELEAANVKYNCARIVRLTSGAFALYSPFTNDTGLALVSIGSLDDLASMIPSADECHAYISERRANEAPIRQSAADHVAGMNLLESLGLAQPFVRRV